MAAKKQTPAPEQTSEQANIDPATKFDPSGAPIQSAPGINPDHPAVDNDPRKGTTVDQNRIDFNDPTISGAKAVEENLKQQDETAEANKSDDK